MEKKKIYIIGDITEAQRAKLEEDHEILEGLPLMQHFPEEKMILKSHELYHEKNLYIERSGQEKRRERRKKERRNKR